MQPYKLKRVIQVSEKYSCKVIAEIPVPEMDANQLTLIFGYQKDDPFLHAQYEITLATAMYFSHLTFDFVKYVYYLSCSRDLTARELEVLTINKYFKIGKAKRYADFVHNEKSRTKFILCLAHLKDLDYDKFRQIENNEKEQILQVVRDQKLNSCYVISENRVIDAQFLDIERAIQMVVGYGMGTLLVFGSAELVYYEGEERNARWISRGRKP